MPASETQRKRTILRLLLAVTVALYLPAWLAPELSSDFFVENAMSPADGRRYMMAHLNAEDYPELKMPQWLQQVEEERGRPRDVEATMAVALSNTESKEPSLTPYDLEDIARASYSHFLDTIAILMYDPPNDAFLMLHNFDRHHKVSAFSKLSTSFMRFQYILRQEFPERFQGSKSPELAIAFTAGDYPHLRKECTQHLPHVSARCPEQEVPVLGFGSVFRHAEIFPNMIPMPMTALHLQCFKSWSRKSDAACKNFRPAAPGRHGGDLVFGETVGLSWENLIPQVVWRGTDFGYLTLIESLSKPHIEDITHKLDPTDKDTDKKILGTRAMREAYDHLLPRWKGVVLTAEAEREAADKSATVPWANIKFSKGKRGTDLEKQEYAQFAEYGIPAIGDSMSREEMAQYKYQLDLGGGGGTTWTGTIQKLAMPGLLFHHVTPTKDYIHDHMQPWVHYVPIAADLSDLKEKYEWAESHPEDAQMIADQGSALMRYLGTAEGFGDLHRKVLVEPVRRIIEAYQPVSTTRRGSSWREVLKKLEGDPYSQVWSCTGNSFYMSTACKREGIKL